MVSCFCYFSMNSTNEVSLLQGIPFFHAGDEMLRSKSLDRDSYNSGDWFNRSKIITYVIYLIHIYLQPSKIHIYEPSFKFSYIIKVQAYIINLKLGHDCFTFVMVRVMLLLRYVSRISRIIFSYYHYCQVGF